MRLRNLPVMLVAGLFVLVVSMPARAATGTSGRCPNAFRQAPGRPLRFRLTAAPAVGLFNADRRPDLVIATPHALRILFGRGHGRFRVGPRLSSIGPPASGLAATDLNNDNLADTVVASGADLAASEGATLQTS